MKEIKYIIISPSPAQESSSRLVLVGFTFFPQHMHYLTLKTQTKTPVLHSSPQSKELSCLLAQGNTDIMSIFHSSFRETEANLFHNHSSSSTGELNY